MRKGAVFSPCLFYYPHRDNISVCFNPRLAYSGAKPDAEPITLHRRLCYLVSNDNVNVSTRARYVWVPEPDTRPVTMYPTVSLSLLNDNINVSIRADIFGCQTRWRPITFHQTVKVYHGLYLMSIYFRDIFRADESIILPFHPDKVPL